MKQSQRHNKPPLRHKQRKHTVTSFNKCTRYAYKNRSTRDYAQCRKYGKKGHFASVCQTKHVHEVKRFLGSVQCEDSDPILGKNIDFKMDSGADTSIMSEETYDTVRQRPKLKPITTTLLGLKSKGQFITHTEVKRQLFHFHIVVVSAKANILLSLSVASRMDFFLKVV